MWLNKRCRAVPTMAGMPRDRPFSFEEESARTRDLWRASQESFVPLPVAAAITFHQAHGSTRAITTRADFDDALNIAATALARLIPLYAAQASQPLPIDLAGQSFARGATELRSASGAAMRELRVRRADLLEALAVIRARGVPFSLVGGFAAPRQNRILGALPEADYARIASAMELVPLELGKALYEAGEVPRHVFFPVSGVVSRLNLTPEGESTEIAVIGNEGVVGVALLLGGGSSLDSTVTQIAGRAYRIASGALLEEFRRGSALQAHVLRYVQALITQMAQTAVCNRHHSIEQQLCRWLLLTLDRIEGSSVVMTQELISHMLGVRRPGVTEAAKKLQAAGVIETRRGEILVRDRAKLEAHACDCYSLAKRETDRIFAG